ncbi:hypothetical protein [Streptomyces sp. NPDC001816]|uniref:hypothetical protein n=1 Tax=Streptomyces sp. NPDC001816 TaxID=3364612 RepID=UPI0036B5F8B9
MAVPGPSPTTTPEHRLTLGFGTDSRGQLLGDVTELLADRLASPLMEFPGGHLGALDHPVEFADALADTLLSNAHTSS